MSGMLKQIASIALPIVGTALGGPIGGAIGGAIGGGLSGGLPGAAFGALGGYAGGGALGGIVGESAGATLAQTTGNALLQGPTMGSGIMGAVSGGGLRALGSGISGAIGGATSPLSMVADIGNQLMTMGQANTAEEAAKLQSQSIDRAVAQQQPYTEAGQKALTQINTINADPSGYIKNNPMYSSLAEDAQRRLFANEAAKGKVGSGGTAAALQDRLLQIGNGLVQQQIGNLQNTANMGQSATNNVSNLTTAQGDVNAAGKVGATNAYSTGYQNQLNTLLAMQNLGKTPSYSPTPAFRL